MIAQSIEGKRPTIVAIVGLAWGLWLQPVFIVAKALGQATLLKKEGKTRHQTYSQEV